MQLQSSRALDVQQALLMVGYEEQSLRAIVPVQVVANRKL